MATTSLSFNVLQLLVIAGAIGIAALKIGPKAAPFLEFNASLLAIVQKVLWWIIRLAPIGTAALIANAVATYGWDAIGSLGVFTAAIYIGLAIVFFVVYPILIAAHGLSVRSFFSGVWPATQLGFVSRSSIGTLPLTERVTERNLGVPREYASFAVPLGATTKMDGCAAIYPAIAAIFVAGFYDVPLTFTDYLLIVVVSVIGSAATAGTPVRQSCSHSHSPPLVFPWPASDCSSQSNRSSTWAVPQSTSPARHWSRSSSQSVRESSTRSASTLPPATVTPPSPRNLSTRNPR